MWKSFILLHQAGTSTRTPASNLDRDQNKQPTPREVAKKNLFGDSNQDNRLKHPSSHVTGHQSSKGVLQIPAATSTPRLQDLLITPRRSVHVKPSNFNISLSRKLHPMLYNSKLILVSSLVFLNGS